MRSQLLAVHLRPLVAAARAQQQVASTSTSSVTSVTSASPVTSTVTPTTTPGQLYFFIKHWAARPISVSTSANNSDSVDGDATTSASTTSTGTSTMPLWRRRMRERIDGAVEKASGKWEALSAEGAAKWKRQVYMAGNRLMDRIDADEWLLKGIHHHTEGLDILTPRHVPASTVIQRLETMCAFRLPHHRRRLTLSLVLLPLSMSASLLPGPNVFLAFNLFRVYSNERAVRGCERLMDVLARRNDQADMPVDADEASDSVTTTAASPTSTASPTASSTTLPVLRIIADDALTAFHEHAPDVHDRTALPLTEEVHYRRLHDHHAMPDHFAHEMRRAQLQVDQRFKSAAARQ